MPYRMHKHKPLTHTSFQIGWMLISFAIIAPFLGDNFRSPNTIAFFDAVPPWLFLSVELLAGYAVAKPGYRYRFWQNVAGVFACMWWVGVSCWGFITNTPGTFLSVIGVMIWVNFAALLINDINDPVYDIDNNAPEDQGKWYRHLVGMPNNY